MRTAYPPDGAEAIRYSSTDDDGEGNDVEGVDDDDDVLLHLLYDN